MVRSDVQRFTQILRRPNEVDSWRHSLEQIIIFYRIPVHEIISSDFIQLKGTHALSCGLSVAVDLHNYEFFSFLIRMSLQERRRIQEFPLLSTAMPLPHIKYTRPKPKSWFRSSDFFFLLSFIWKKYICETEK